MEIAVLGAQKACGRRSVGGRPADDPFGDVGLDPSKERYARQAKSTRLVRFADSAEQPARGWKKPGTVADRSKSLENFIQASTRSTALTRGTGIGRGDAALSARDWASRAI